METRKQLCKKCNVEKPRDRFRQYGNDRLGKPCYRKVCIDCRNAQNRKARNDYGWNEKLKAKKREFKEEIVAFRGGACERCGQVLPAYCYDFHHVDENTKLYTIANLMAYSISDTIRTKVYEEMEKCVMVCSNCHRIIHREQQIEENNDTSE